jgi:enterochelin esterase-like enzyme
MSLKAKALPSDMKRFYFFVVLCVVLTATWGCSPEPSTTPASTPSPGCLEDGTIHDDGSIDSPTLGRVIRFQYYLPPCYERQTGVSYPVLYLIHGASGNEATWKHAGVMEVANQLIRQGKVPPFILVTPATRHFDDRHGDALVSDLVPYIDGNLRTLPHRQYRAVGGASAGAAQAICMGFKYPDVFGSVGVFGGGVFPDDEEAFYAWLTAEQPNGQTTPWPRVLIDVGDKDGMRGIATRLASDLEQHGIPNTLNIGMGGHSYYYWGDNFAMYLRWYTEGWQETTDEIQPESN